MKIILSFVLFASAVFAQTRVMNIAWTPSTTPSCSATVTTNCVSGYNVYRAASSAGPWITPLNSAPISGSTFQDVAAPIQNGGATLGYAVLAFSISCTGSGAPPSGWTLCGSSSPLVLAVGVPMAPGAAASMTINTQ